MSEVTRLGDFCILSKVDEGSFGQIYTVRSRRDGKIYAAKVENLYARKKTVQFEAKVLNCLQKSEYVPRFIYFGHASRHTFLIMELLGPSIPSILKRIQSSTLSLSSGVRVAIHLLRAIYEIHQLGIIHRDIKPANVLITNNMAHPIAIIDFGLSRLYQNKDGVHMPARNRPGFRGTAIFASCNAHMHLDLSRRDDLISWFYVITDLITGTLPWKRLESRADILHAKRRNDVSLAFSNTLPEMIDIWNLIKDLRYEDAPDYQQIEQQLFKAMKRLEIHMDDSYDWIAIPFDKQFSYSSSNLSQRADYDISSSDKRNAQDKSYGINSAPLLHDQGKEKGCCCNVA